MISKGWGAYLDYTKTFSNKFCSFVIPNQNHIWKSFKGKIVNILTFIFVVVVFVVAAALYLLK